jgi:hypothetical protein
MADGTILRGTPSLAHADAAVSCGDRIMWHAQVEVTNVIDDVMGTITPADSLSWARTWAWAAPLAGADGAIKLRTLRTRDEIRAFYVDNRSRYQVTDTGRPQMRVCSDWYAMTESHATFESLPDHTEYRQSWVLVSPMDGTHGITGELVWARFPHLEPGPEISAEDICITYERYLEALRAQDVDGLLALMAPGVQGAVRDYAGDETFVGIDGPEEMRAFYQRMFAAVRVRAVDTVQFVNRGWYMFSEHRWTVDFLAGPRQGSSGALLIAELLPLDREGRIYARLGFGTELLSV